MTAVCDVPPKVSIMSPAPTVNAAATNLGELNTTLQAVTPRTGKQHFSHIDRHPRITTALRKKSVHQHDEHEDREAPGPQISYGSHHQCAEVCQRHKPTPSKRIDHKARSTIGCYCADKVYDCGTISPVISGVARSCQLIRKLWQQRGNRPPANDGAQ